MMTQQLDSESSDAVWCPDTQTFKGGIVPRHSAETLTIDELLACNGDKLKIFGCGSLCVRLLVSVFPNIDNASLISLLLLTAIFSNAVLINV